MLSRLYKFYPFLFLCLAVCFAILLHSGIASPEGRPVCLGCHETKMKLDGKTVHPVIERDGCVACHTKPHSKKAKDQKFLFANGVDLCFACHDKTTFSKEIIHPPVAEGQCQSCHDVHASENPKLLISKLPDLCFQCHDRARFTDKRVHPPVAEGQCTACHDPHSSRVKKLLIAEAPDLCFRCHREQMFSGKKDVHAPVAAGLCTFCHEPHASTEEKLLVEQTPELCYRCHDQKVFEGKMVHSPVASGNCATCHNLHQSDFDKLLVKKMPDLCFNCHNKRVFTQKTPHRPVAEGKCMSCHKHAADYKALLPSTKNKLCLTCHPGIAEESHIVGTFTEKGHPVETKGFKVVDGKRIKLSCVSCHKPHGSEWIRIFKFEAKSTTGICSNCHDK